MERGDTPSSPHLQERSRSREWESERERGSERKKESEREDERKRESEREREIERGARNLSSLGDGEGAVPPLPHIQKRFCAAESGRVSEQARERERQNERERQRE